MMEKMEIYDRHREVPAEAKKTIGAGRLKGMTDVNPMWRIKALTEEFGACGTGWKYEIDERWTEEYNGEVAVFIQIGMQYRTEDGWSDKVIGVGGSKLLAKEKNGMYFNDEAYKMATTDAISVACKQLGIGADVYWAADRTKYSAPPDANNAQAKDKRTYLLENLKVACAKFGIDDGKLAGIFEKNNIDELTEIQLQTLQNKWGEIKANGTYRKNPQPEQGLPKQESAGDAGDQRRAG